MPGNSMELFHSAAESKRSGIMEQIRENKMGTQSVFKIIVSMSLPAVFSMLVQALYNICLLYTSVPTSSAS